MSMIETRDLKKSFRARRGTVEAVKGVDLRVEQGEIFGFLGPNGRSGRIGNPFAASCWAARTVRAAA